MKKLLPSILPPFQRRQTLAGQQLNSAVLILVSQLTKRFLISAPTRRAVLPVPVLLLLASCSGLKFVPAGERLYTGSKVTIKPPAGEKH